MATAGHNEERLDGLCDRDRQNANVFLKWTFAWAVSLFVAVIFLGPSDTGMTNISLFHYGLVMLPLVATFFMVKTYLHFFNHADELIRMLLLSAKARGFGIVFILGIVFTLSAQLFGEWEDAGAIMWLAGFLTFEISFLKKWKQFNAE